MTIEEYEKKEKENAEKWLSKGYYLYIYYSIEGYYRVKPVDPNYVDIEKFKERYAHDKILYSSYEEVRKELDILNKTCCDYDLKMKARVSSISACKEADWISQPSYEKGYIAGTKENGIRWHDLRKDPNDLPKENGLLMSKTLLLIIKMKGSDCSSLALGQYNFSTQEFSYQHIVGLTDVIAWCEIPTFEKE